MQVSGAARRLSPSRVGGVPRSCSTPISNPLGACLCGAAQPPLHNAHARVLQCAHVLFADVGQSQAREEGERPGFAAGAGARSLPSTLDNNSWLHCYLRMCIPYRQSSARHPRTCPRTWHPPRAPSSLAAGLPHPPRALGARRVRLSSISSPSRGPVPRVEEILACLGSGAGPEGPNCPETLGTRGSTLVLG